MNLDNFVVRPHRRRVETVRRAGRLDSAVAGGRRPSSLEHLAGLPSAVHDDDEDAKRFDLLVLRASWPSSTATPSPRSDCGRRSRRLPRRCSEDGDPVGRRTQAAAGGGRRRRVVDRRHPAHAGGARLRLRGLVRFVEKTARNPVYTDFEDSSAKPVEVACRGHAGHELRAFPRKGRAYLRAARGPRRAAAAAPQQAAHRRRPRRAGADARAHRRRPAGRHRLGRRAGARPRALRPVTRRPRPRCGSRGVRPLPRRQQVLRRPGPLREPDRRRAHRERRHGAGRLYESPYTDHAPTGPDYFFPDADVEPSSKSCTRSGTTPSPPARRRAA